MGTSTSPGFFDTGGGFSNFFSGVYAQPQQGPTATGATLDSTTGLFSGSDASNANLAKALQALGTSTTGAANQQQGQPSYPSAPGAAPAGRPQHPVAYEALLKAMMQRRLDLLNSATGGAGAGKVAPPVSPVIGLLGY
jgi:hypothetical protein